VTRNAPSTIEGPALEATSSNVSSLATGASNPDPPESSPGAPVSTRQRSTVASRPSRTAPAQTGGQDAIETAKTPPGALCVTARGAFSGGLNCRECWQARARRVQRERLAVATALAGHAPLGLPVTIAIHRVAWNTSDPDGLAGALKGVVDQVAVFLGVDDRHRGLHLRLSQSITREMRFVKRGRRAFREPATELRITVRPWTHEDGEDALVVATAPNPKRIRQPKSKGNAP
jgi:hypothetical protein